MNTTNPVDQEQHPKSKSLRPLTSTSSSDTISRHRRREKGASSDANKILSRRNVLAIGIAVAIGIVLGNHWRLAVHHVRDLHIYRDLSPTISSSFLKHGKKAAPDDHIPRPLPRRRHPFYNAARYSNPHHLKSDPFVLSPICGGCYRSFRGRNACVAIIERHQKAGLTLLEAAREVGSNIPDCYLCHPEKCLERYFNDTEIAVIRERGRHPKSGQTSGQKNVSTKYWRFDHAAPRFTNPTTITLPSIPTEHRVPPSRFQDIGNYFHEKHASSPRSFDSGMDFLFEYNPGLVALSPSSRQHLPSDAAYLLSLRVTPANNCFDKEVYANMTAAVWDAVYRTTTNHLGLALLDAKYQIIPGYDVVIDMDLQLGLRRSMFMGLLGPCFMDYRLFLLNGDIYLHINADTVIVTKLTVTAKGLVAADDDSQKDYESPPKGKVKFEDLPERFRLRNLFGGDKLQVTLEHKFNTIWSGGVNGKNYALFSIPNTTHPRAPDAIYAEIDINPRHIVHQFLPDEYDLLSRQQVFDYLWKPGTRKNRNFPIDKINRRSVKIVTNRTETESAPLPSFFTADEHWFPGSKAPFKGSGHGGACCVSFTPEQLHHQHHESLLVGVAHTKVTWKRWYSDQKVPSYMKENMLPHTHYVSFIYAFDPYPPFQLRARSGFFCLGFAFDFPDDERGRSDSLLQPKEGGIFNPHSALTRNRILKQHNETFECPQIHYVSAFVEKANDASRTVLGYGLNDCTARLIEVEKNEISRLLYPNPSDMVFDLP